MAVIAEPLPTVRAGDLRESSASEEWLIRSIWSKGAAGLLGGSPKLGKSWLGLDMAVSVASGTPCLDRFEVEDAGPVLVYLAEDPLTAVRARIDAICQHRSLDLSRLDLFAVDVPSLHLDVQTDRLRLEATLEKIRPRLLLLDPLIRMHSIDENSSHDVALLLGSLTRIQRRYGCAIVLVHHASKRGAARPGEALRGSTDLHAWGGSNAYLQRRGEQTVLSLEHRAARPPVPIAIDLVSRPDGSATHFEVIAISEADSAESIEDRVLRALRDAHAPLRRQDLRAQLRINNERLGHTLAQLERERRVNRTEAGWTLR